MKSFNSVLLGAVVYPDEQLIPFYGGIMSQWADCEIQCEKLLPGITLNCAEQGMMLMKAKEFNDDDAYEAILKADHPSKQKSIGRQVKNFDPVQWDEVVFDYVTEINYCKFSQNLAWGEALKLTDPYYLVEASPTDKIWGIGMSEYNENITDRLKWNGTNWLGKAIMVARTRLIADS